MNFLFDRNTFWNQIPAQFADFPDAAADAVNFLLDSIEQDDIHWENLNQVAYAFATFKWETANTFQPVHEKGPQDYFSKYDPGTPLGETLGNTEPGDGFLFRGRGFVQITGRENYAHIGNLLGVDLVATPDEALQPDVAYRIAAGGMSQGWFTGRRLSQYMPLNASPDYVNARRIINRLDHAQDIAAYAQKFQTILQGAERPQA